MNKRSKVLVGWAVMALVFFGLWILEAGSTRPLAERPSVIGYFFAFGVLAGIWYFLNFINAINEWERRPVLFFGRYKTSAGPGFALIEPLFHTILPDVPINDTVIIIPIREVQTKNNVNIGYEGVLTIRIPEGKVQDSVVKVGNIMSAIVTRASATLADETGKSVLDQLLEHRDEFMIKVKKELVQRIGAWGPEVVAFEIRNFTINDESIAQAIAMTARAEKEAQAELARAKMQLQVTEQLNEAAAKLTEEGRWLKGIEVLVELTRSATNNTILVPTDLTSGLAAALTIKK